MHMVRTHNLVVRNFEAREARGPCPDLADRMCSLQHVFSIEYVPLEIPPALAHKAVDNEFLI